MIPGILPVKCYNGILCACGILPILFALINTNNVAEKKFLNLKSHDCQVLMTQLLPVALRGILPPNLQLATMKLCSFLNAIS
jgi:hypothetical protein